jgi:hypothetical protein
LIIEFNGIKWHPKEGKTKEYTDIYGNKNGDKIFEEHKIKLELARSKGFETLVI